MNIANDNPRYADELQNSIHEWAERTFTHTEKGIAAHLLSEAAELYFAAGGITWDANLIVSKARHKPASAIPEETADVTILALTMAGHMGFRLDREVWSKMAKNVKRTWGKPNEHGFTEHVEEAAV